MKIFSTVILLIAITAGYSQTDDLEKIKHNIRAFSEALMQGDTSAINNAYTADGKIMPNGTLILEGQPLKEYWNKGIRNGQRYFLHHVEPVEIKVLGDYAYDFGYYKGESGYGEKRSEWGGKYVIIWRKTADDWKIYVDIWNGIPQRN